MNEQAKEVLAQLMQRALDGVDAAVEFSQQQVPEVVQQLLTWHFVESFIWFSVGVLFLTLSVWSGFRLWRYRGKAIRDRADGEEWTRYAPGSALSSPSYDFAVVAVFILTPVFSLVSFSMIATNLEWLKIWLAPKLYLLEYGASLVK